MSRPTAKLIQKTKADDGREIDIYLITPDLVFEARSGEFKERGPDAAGVLAKIRAKMGTPLLTWIPVIDFTYNFDGHSMALSLARGYVAKSPRGWLIAGAGAINEEVLILSESDVRANNLLPLPVDLTEAQRTSLFAKSKRCLTDIPDEGVGTGVRSRSGNGVAGVLPFDENLFARLLALQDMIHTAAREIGKLLDSPEGIQRLLTAPMALALTAGSSES